MHDEDSRTLSEEWERALAIIDRVNGQLGRWEADIDCCPPAAAEWAANDLEQVVDVFEAVQEVAEERYPDEAVACWFENAAEGCRALRRRLFTLAAEARGCGLSGDEMREGDRELADFFEALDEWRGED